MNLNLPLLKMEVASDRRSLPRIEDRPVPLIRTPPAQGLASAEASDQGVRVLYCNAELLQRYLSGRQLRLKTKKTYKSALASFNRLVGIPLEEAGRPELEEWYRRSSSLGLAASSIHTYTSRLRRLLEYALEGRGLSRVDARARAGAIMEGVPVVDLRREMKLRQPGRDKLVTPEEIRDLKEAAKHPRTKALLSVLIESGCRKGELLSLRVRDYSVRETHVELLVQGKTGERVIPLVKSVKHLQAWLQAHPDPRPGAPLFATVVSGEIRRMSLATPNRLLMDLCARAGIRHVNPHMLRHTRLTELARKGVGEYVLKSFAGWSPDSNMAARYIHLSGRAHVDAILKVSEEAEV